MLIENPNTMSVFVKSNMKSILRFQKQKNEVNIINDYQNKHLIQITESVIEIIKENEKILFVLKKGEHNNIDTKWKQISSLVDTILAVFGKFDSNNSLDPIALDDSVYKFVLKLIDYDHNKLFN